MQSCIFRVFQFQIELPYTDWHILHICNIIIYRGTLILVFVDIFFKHHSMVFKKHSVLLRNGREVDNTHSIVCEAMNEKHEETR